MLLYYCSAALPLHYHYGTPLLYHCCTPAVRLSAVVILCHGCTTRTAVPSPCCNPPVPLAGLLQYHLCRSTAALLQPYCCCCWIAKLLTWYVLQLYRYCCTRPLLYDHRSTTTAARNTNYRRLPAVQLRTYRIVRQTAAYHYTHNKHLLYNHYRNPCCMTRLSTAASPAPTPSTPTLPGEIVPDPRPHPQRTGRAPP